MKKYLKRAIRLVSIALCFALAAGAAACKPTADRQGATAENVTVWTERGTEKVRHGVDYTARYNQKTLSFKAFRNEYEAAQIILSLAPNEKGSVKSYTLALSDLTDGAGNTLTKDAFTVYNQKYVNVTSIKDPLAVTLLGNTIGYYPDALLPYETAVAYGENKVERFEGEEVANQGLWIRVKPPKAQAAGVYHGSFTLTIDGIVHIVPVEVTVYDYTLGDYTHTKSSYAFSLEAVARAEHDSTVEMMNTYYEFLLDHRIMAETLPVSDLEPSVLDDATLQSFLDCAVKYTNDPRCTSFNLPFIRSSASNLNLIYNEDGKLQQIYVNGYENPYNEFFGLDNNGKYIVGSPKSNPTVNVGKLPAERMVEIPEDDERIVLASYGCYDETNYLKLLRAMARRSVEEGVDLFRKAATYFIYFDEFTSVTAPSASYSLQRAYDTGVALSKEFESLTLPQGVDEETFAQKSGMSFDEFKKKLCESVKNIRHKSVSQFQTEMVAELACWCPQISQYGIESEYEKYVNADEGYVNQGYNSERWTYTCMLPQVPYPTFHNEDALLSARTYGWMMYKNDIVGHLFWATTLYSQSQTAQNANKQEQLMNYYGQALHYASSNGDGYLMYPGRPYGIFGPVDTIRLQALQDGMEDYDLLYELETLYRERGVKDEQFERVYEQLCKELFSGTQMRYRDGYLDYFDESRAMLADLLAAAKNVGVIVEDVQVEKGKGTATVSAPQNVTITVDGAQQSGSTENGQTRYTISFTMEKTSNALSLSATADGKTYDVTLGLGGRVVQTPIADMRTLVVENEWQTYTAVNSEQRDGEDVLAFTFGAVEEDGQMVDFDIASLSVTHLCAAVSFDIYYDGDEPIKIEIIAHTDSVGALSGTVYTGTLVKGKNTCRIPISAFTFDTANAVIANLRFEIETNSALTLAVSGIVVEG